MREKNKFLSAGLSYGKKQFGQQPAKSAPVGVGFIQAIQVFIRNEANFRILHRFNKIPAWVAGNEASERNDELVLRKKEDILVFFSIRVAVINPEYAFYNQAKVVTNHGLHIEEISFTHLSRFPKRLAIADVSIV